MAEAADIKISKLDPLSRGSFAVVSTWPDTKNAEYEVVQRLISAGKNIGMDVIVIDNDGYPLEWTTEQILLPNRRITQDDCEFVISLHFESPRLYDIFSYIALWNPPEFYHAFGYARTSERLASHNDVLSCHSEIADAHALNIFNGFGRRLPTPFPSLFHSLPAPFLEPRIGQDSRLFYIGINWERISGQRGRHQELLEKLDNEDLIWIYGPEEFHGVKPWHGFKTYRGSIPFDGKSVLTEINKAGICLAFSSAAHQRSGIMSNRLFEGLAAGAVIIANPHPFIDKYFADCVYVVDDRLEPAELCEHVRDLVLKIRNDPAGALARAQRGQQRLRESFSLDFCLEGLVASHPERVAAYTEEPVDSNAQVSVLIDYTGRDIVVLVDMLANAARQVRTDIECILICGEDFYHSHQRRIHDACTGAIKSFRSIGRPSSLNRPADASALRASPTSGLLVSDTLTNLEAPFFCLMRAGEHWFSDHLCSLTRTLRQNPQSYIACSGRITEDAVGKDKTRRRLESLRFESIGALLDATYEEDAGRFLYRTELVSKLPKALLSLLDGHEHCAFQLWGLLQGPLSQSNYASFVQADVSDRTIRKSEISEEQQIAFIRDSVRGNLNWLRLRNEFQQEAGAQTRRLIRLQFNHLYELRDGGDGLSLMRSGFSHPESQFTWIDGRTAKLEFELAPSTSERELVLVVGGRKARDTGDDQRCTVIVNDEVVLDQVVVAEGRTELRAPLPSAAGAQRGKMRLTLSLGHAEQVTNSEGQVIDPRYLGMQVAAIGVFPADDLDQIQLNHLYELRDGGDGLSLMRGGFSHPEPQFTWIDGRTAKLEFELAPSNSERELVLVVGGRSARDTGEDQRCTVTVNDKVLLDQVVVVEGRSELRAPLPSATGAQLSKVRVTLNLNHAEQVTNSKGQVIDPRYLGMQVAAIGVFYPPNRQPSSPTSQTGSHSRSRLRQQATYWGNRLLLRG
jgi:hypothetical protein